MKKLKKLGIILLTLACWFLLLLAMVSFESGSADASIQSITDALWFSIVTLTTVGYGDFFPVSPFGKLIGIVFIILSVGFFSLVISFFINMIRNQAIPRFRLIGKGGKKWYYFTAINAKTIALASDIKQTEADAVIILDQLPDTGNEYKDQCRELDALCFSTSPEELLKMKKSDSKSLSVFFMDEDGYENYQKGLETTKALPQIRVYSETEFRPEQTEDSFICFDQYDTLARLFWQKHGLKKGKNEIVLIGFEKYGTRLLERAFLTNIYGDEVSANYHVFGDSEEFEASHTSMLELLDYSLDSEDRILFYPKPWYQYPEVLRNADMILLCQDSDRDNLETLQKIRKSFPVSGNIYLKTGFAREGIESFGATDEIYTADQVIREKLMKTAKALHELYVRSKETKGQKADHWEDLPEILRHSNIAAADHLLIKARILLKDSTLTKLTPDICQKAYDTYVSIPLEDRDAYWRLEHTRWMRFFASYNFTYGEKKDFDKKRHPSYVAYDELDYDTKSYDDNEWKLLIQYCEHPELFQS